MSTPRPYQFIALKRLAASHQTRQLHMTGPATFSPLLNSERPVSNLPRDIAGLRAECKRRRIDFSGTKQDLMSRLNADELAHSRAFTTAIANSKRPTATSTELKETATPVRHFNTSRALKAVKDSSTIDFAYLPDFDADPEQASAIRIPLLPSSGRTTSHQETPDATPMKAEISSMSHNSNFSAMADVHDNTAMQIDFHAVADSVSNAASSAATSIKEKTVVADEASSSTLKAFWAGIMDDVMGPKKPSPA